MFPILLLVIFPSPALGRPTSAVTTSPPESVDVLISNRHGDHRLFGTYSPAGINYETTGKVAQVSTFRACDARRRGLDTTVFGHVAVLFVDEVHPFLTGCVALDNQARFVEKSGALALIVGPASKVQLSNRPLKVHSSKIPVVVLDDAETLRLRSHLTEAADDGGSETTLRLVFVEPKTTQVLRVQVFRPTIINLALIALLILLIVFITVLVFVKVRWRPTAHREIWLRTLARAAVNKMEIRKIQKLSDEKRRPFARIRKVRSTYLPVFGSLTSVANTTSGQDRCTICLEEYREGTELRVLFCGHEFHPKCVDPWLLANRRCPLCQFDVVYKQYPVHETTKKNTRSAPASGDSSPSEPLLPPTPSSPPLPPRIQRPLRARSLPRRRRLRRRDCLDTAVRIGGYSSDVSSYTEMRDHVIL